MTAANCYFLVSVNESQGANLWPCRPVNYEPSQWWCGDVSVTPICQSGNQGFFHDYTSGSILGFPPTTASPSASTQGSCELATTTFYIPASAAIQSSCDVATTTFHIPAPSPTKMSTAPSLSAQTQRLSTNLPTDPPAPAQSQRHSANLTTAIGVGVGVPLGIAVIGFLGFFFWRAAERKRESKSRTLNQKHALGNGDQFASLVIDRPWTELPDAQLPRELDDTGRKELPG